MAVFTHRRGQLREYTRHVRASYLYQQVTIEEFLAMQYPPELLRSYPEQAARDREAETALILSALQPGDTLWLWTREGQWDTASAGVAVKRSEEIIRAWLVWSGW